MQCLVQGHPDAFTADGFDRPRHGVPAEEDAVLARQLRALDDRARPVVQRRLLREMVAAGLEELLPLDAERRAEGMVRAEFAARALREQSLGAVARSLRSTLLARVTLAVENGQECGETAPAFGAAAAAGAALELVALSEGLAAALLVEPDATDVARLAPDDAADAAPAASVEVLRGACARVFPGSCARAEVTAAANRLDQASGQ